MNPIRPLRLRIVLGLGLGLALALPAAAPAAETVVLAAGRDNTLSENANGTLSNGAGTGFFVGRTSQVSGSIRRALLWFDVAAAIPAGATITAVRLQLSLSQTVAPASNIGAHEVGASWGEGTSDAGPAGGSGAPSQAGDATWKHRFFPGTNWTTLGGDFAAVASATIGVDGPGTYVWGSTPGLVADVQGWIDAPAGNHGWLLRGNEATAPTVNKFESRESTLAALRPALTIEYELPVPAETSTWGRVKGDYR